MIPMANKPMIAHIIELLRAHGIRLTKRRGQHYLIDPHVTRKLVRLCGLTKTDTVVEIGPGLGALTDLLAAEAGRVIAVDIDRGVCEALNARMAGLPNVEVRCEDILAFRWEQHPGCTVVGALPYSITSPILARLCEHVNCIKDAWLAMQREVGQRLAAKPGTKAYGRLTVLVQYHFEVRPAAAIPRGAFFPEPAVESAWLNLRPRPEPAVSVRDPQLLFDVVQAAFSQRRKTLLNCLTQLTQPRLDRNQAAAAIRQAGLPPGVRGEALSLEEFARLTEVLGGG